MPDPGEGAGTPSSYRLVLMGYYDDNRIQEPYAIIPVRNGKFEYVCQLGESKMYWLVFTDELVKSAFRPVCFLLNGGSRDHDSAGRCLYGFGNSWRRSQ